MQKLQAISAEKKTYRKYEKVWKPIKQPNNIKNYQLWKLFGTVRELDHSNKKKNIEKRQESK